MGNISSKGGICDGLRKDSASSTEIIGIDENGVKVKLDSSQMRQQFREIDTDGSGAVDRQEFEEYLYVPPYTVHGVLCRSCRRSVDVSDRSTGSY